jgi:Uma2 family endonuclease
VFVGFVLISLKSADVEAQAGADYGGGDILSEKMNRAASQTSRRDRGRDRSRNGWSLDDVQHIVLDNVSWELYEHLLKEIGERPIRLTYDSGDLEIMSPLPEHEFAKKVFARLVETLAEELDIPIQALGSTTFRRKLRQRGLEPDECYYIRHAAVIRGKRILTLPKDPPPDLVIEIDITARSIARMPIYAALRVPEIWHYEGKRLECLVLGEDGNYHASDRSLSFPMLRPRDLTRFVRVARGSDLTAMAKAFRQWIRRQDWTR